MGDELPTSTGDRRISEPSRVFGLKPNALNIWKHFNMKISRTEFPVYMETRQRQRNCDIQLLQTVTCHSFSDRDRYHEPWWEHLNSNNSSNFQGDEKCEWRGYHNLTPQLHTGMIPLLFSIFVFGHSSPSHTWRPSSYPWQRNDGQSHGRTLRLFHSKESLKEAWEVRNSLRGSLPKNWHRIRLLELFYWNFWVPFRTTQSMLEIDRYIIYIYIISIPIILFRNTFWFYKTFPYFSHFLAQKLCPSSFSTAKAATSRCFWIWKLWRGGSLDGLGAKSCWRSGRSRSLFPTYVCWCLLFRMMHFCCTNICPFHICIYIYMCVCVSKNMILYIVLVKKGKDWGMSVQNSDGRCRVNQASCG